MLSKPLEPLGEHPWNCSGASLPALLYAPQLGHPIGIVPPCTGYWESVKPPTGPEKKNPVVLGFAAIRTGDACLLAATFGAAMGHPFSTAFTCACTEH